MFRKRVLWILLFLSMVLIGLPSKYVFAETVEKYPTGCILASEEDYEKVPMAPIPAQGVTLPDAHDFSGYFPQPGNQERQGSCVAWAVGYAYKGYQERVERYWKGDSPEHLFSPSFIYNLRRNRGNNITGMTVIEAMEIVENFGVCTMKTMPYDSTTDTTDPSEEAFREAKSFRGIRHFAINPKDIKLRVEIVKAYLAQNIPVVIVLPVYPELRTLGENGDFVYDEVREDSRNTEYHAVTLTGYDDGSESFKFINSWGTDWGDGGYGYVSYDFLSKQSNIELYILEDGGFRFIGNHWKYLETTGYAKNKWIYDLRDWYFFNEDGDEHTGWLNRWGSWYYLRTAQDVPKKGGPVGSMCRGWIFVNNNWYYLRPETNVPIPGTEGVMCTGWIFVDGYWYYLRTAYNVPQAGSEGAMCKGWIKIKEYWYYLRPEGNVPNQGPSGSMLQNTSAIIGNKRYYFDGSGHCTNPY